MTTKSAELTLSFTTADGSEYTHVGNKASFVGNVADRFKFYATDANVKPPSVFVIADIAFDIAVTQAASYSKNGLPLRLQAETNPDDSNRVVISRGYEDMYDPIQDADIDVYHDRVKHLASMAVEAYQRLN